jgi:hypothetical protein
VNNLTEETMEIIRKYLILIIVIVPVGVAVLLRSTGTGHFRYDAARWSEPALEGSNYLTPRTLSGLNGNILLVDMSEKGVMSSDRRMERVKINADSVIMKDFRKIIERNNGPVVLWSDDTGVSARVWMFLSQTGIKDLYILGEDPLNEGMKEKFRADSLIRPEF